MDFTLHVGFSKDGIDWAIDPEPLAMESDDSDVVMTAHSYDPRLTRLEERYYVTWCNAGRAGADDRAGNDEGLKTFERMESARPTANRNCVIFPRKINGEFAVYHRPCDRGHTPFGDIFYATSPDFVTGDGTASSLGRLNGWRSLTVGPGPHPIETAEGWLLIYHGVWKSCNGYLYYVGGALLDLEKPWRCCIARRIICSRRPKCMNASEMCRMCFPSSAIVEGDHLRLYYGCADTCVSMAEAKLSDVVEFVKTHGYGPTGGSGLRLAPPIDPPDAQCDVDGAGKAAGRRRPASTAMA